MIQEALTLISGGKNLSVSQMQQAMEEIMSGKVQTQDIVSFLVGLSLKGETIDELTAAVEVLRSHVIRIHARQKIVLDTCGTGGDSKGIFNVSTAVAFAASGAGITVAKHGNRAVSSLSGSADILEALGVNINLNVSMLQKCLNEIGIAFLFAQSLHPAMKYAMPARKQIGKKTIFNLLGPLTNPAGATHQLVGVYDAHWAGVLAEVLKNTGTKHALVVHSEDGLDEISTTSKTKIYEVSDGKITNYGVSPEDFGFKRVDLKALSGADALTNSKILLDCLNGKSGPYRDIVILNAAAAIYAADSASSIKDAIGLAQDSIDSGKALEKLELLKEYSNRKS